jgi:SAM-dependent methyltransferase
MIQPSLFDVNALDLSRKFLSEFIKDCADKISNDNLKLLEIGPQGRSEVKEHFYKCNVSTLDIDSKFNPDIIGDLTKFNKHITESSFDIIACLEVLEHTLNPFSSIEELRRILKHGGYLLISAPLNFRIHGPIPDCWRFTEFGWKVLLKDFEIVEMRKLETSDRSLFPITYNILVRCDKTKNVDVDTMKFERIN